MNGLVAKKLDDFENGKISRRKLIEVLTIAASSAYAVNEASAAQSEGLTAALVNHISYSCPNHRQAADWYAKVFNLEPIEKGDQIVLPFGKKGERPYNVQRDDVPHTFMVLRSRDADTPPTNGAPPRRKSQAVINHFAYTIADFDRNRVLAELKRLGLDNPREDGEHSFHIADPFGYHVQISGINMTAFTGGG